ncbi:ABC transporter ATP-binding protein [Candidatus Riflebacteria bacterium]
MNNFLRILKRARPYLGLFLASIICAIIVALSNIYPVFILKDIIDKVLLAKDMVTLNIIAITLLAVMALKGVASFFQNYSMSYIAEKVIFKLRQETFHRLQHFDLTFYEKNHSGNLISIVANDAQIIQQLMQTIVDLMVQIATFLGLIILIFYLHWKLTLISLIVIPLVGLTVNIFSNKMKKYGLNIQKRIGELSAALGESFQGITVIKCFNLEEYSKDRFNSVNEGSFNASLKCRKLDSVTVPVIEFINTISLCVILYFGGYEVIAGRLSTGQMMSFITALVSLFTPIKRLTKINTMIAQSVGASERIFDLLDNVENLETIEEESKEKIMKVTGKVVFENVSFSYDNKELVLHDINMTCMPGQKVAFVGASGSGKSTITRLLARFYSPAKGKIMVDGIDISSINLFSLRKHIGIVPQDVFLFNMSIFENIQLGRTDASKEEIILATKAANALEFIENLPDGFETMLGERGCNLSGGQKQRLSIARAILKNPKILILDEATSALDSESETLVQEALERLMMGRTTFIIAHRLSTIMNADKIIVIQAGKVVEFGRHSELLKEDGPYKNLFTSQYREKKSCG